MQFRKHTAPLSTSLHIEHCSAFSSSSIPSRSLPPQELLKIQQERENDVLKIQQERENELFKIQQKREKDLLKIQQQNFELRFYDIGVSRGQYGTTSTM